MEKYWFLVRQSKDKNLINTFFINMVFHHIGLSCIIQSNKKTSFDLKKNGPSWIFNGPWNTTTIFSRLNGSVFEDYCITAKHEKYNLMCSIEAHTKIRNHSASKNM